LYEATMTLTVAHFLQLLETTLRGAILERKGWGGTCDQPFRLFSYSLPSDVAPLLTAHVLAKEAAAIPTEHVLQHPKTPLVKAPNGQRRVLTVAYMSSDFGSHTVASLIGGLLRKHDRVAFQVVGLALKTAGDIHQEKMKAGEWGKELRDSFALFLDLGEVSDREASLSIQRAKVHILIDLNGFSKGGRQGLLLRRPAPVSASFLGYPATLGGCVDFIVTDRVAAPPELHQGLMYEGELMMPHSYFVNDYPHLYPRPLAPARDSEGQAGCGRPSCFTDSTQTPHQGAVLANFGQMYKIQPELFLSWCRAIRGGANASLWLLKFPKQAAPMIAAHFSKRCGFRHQLVLSELLPMDRHLSGGK
jgi:protein O-GlcNAc transferase